MKCMIAFQNIDYCIYSHNARSLRNEKNNMSCINSVHHSTEIVENLRIWNKSYKSSDSQVTCMTMMKTTYSFT